MKLEPRHTKIINALNYETFITLNDVTPTQRKAINELYAKNKILIGCQIGGGGKIGYALKLSKRIKNYNKKII